MKVYIDEFWTPKQRQSSSIHEVPYRACFKPEMPNYFIKLFSKEKDIIYDPFAGRGTTAIESGLLNRNVISNDINPLSKILTFPRFFIPDYSGVKKRLDSLKICYDLKPDIDLSMFYHNETELEILSLRSYLKERKENNKDDNIDKWIRMVATSRLTGHSKGFFSTYSLPPNQSISQKSQIKINEKLNQKPEYKNVKDIILKKTKSLIRNLNNIQINNLFSVGNKSVFLSKDASKTDVIRNSSVDLIITSPPFLNTIDYCKDNWLRCWFNSINIEKIKNKMCVSNNIEKWCIKMHLIFEEFYRVVKTGGRVIFEVGEIRNGKIKLEEYVVPIGLGVGFNAESILINCQKFTKTSNIWGIKNNKNGTNTNRIIIFKK